MDFNALNDNFWSNNLQNTQYCNRKFYCLNSKTPRFVSLRIILREKTSITLNIVTLYIKMKLIFYATVVFSLRIIFNESKHVKSFNSKLYITILCILFVTVSKINILNVSSSTAKWNQHNSLLLLFQPSQSMQYLQSTVHCCHLAPQCFNISKFVTRYVSMPHILTLSTL